MQRRPNHGAFTPRAESWRRGRDHPNPGDRSATWIVAEVGGWRDPAAAEVAA
jgi:hypothetical protein